MTRVCTELSALAFSRIDPIETLVLNAKARHKIRGNTVSKSQAMNIFALSYKDVSAIPAPHIDRGGIYQYTYNLRELAVVAYRKHGSWSAIQCHLAERSRKKEARKMRKRIKQQQE